MLSVVGLYVKVKHDVTLSPSAGEYAVAVTYMKVEYMSPLLLLILLYINSHK
jgi:hypothetical protein